MLSFLSDHKLCWEGSWSLALVSLSALILGLFFVFFAGPSCVSQIDILCVFRTFFAVLACNIVPVTVFLTLGEAGPAQGRYLFLLRRTPAQPVGFSGYDSAEQMAVMTD